MAQFFIQPEILKKFRTHFVISGILLIIIGTIGIVLPALMSLSVSMFVGWMLRNGDKITSPTMHHSFRPSLPDLKSQKY